MYGRRGCPDWWVIHGSVFNVRCVSLCRLEGVEVRLQETAEAFEQTRLLARRTKAEFEKVKKQRCAIV